MPGGLQFLRICLEHQLPGLLKDRLQFLRRIRLVQVQHQLPGLLKDSLRIHKAILIMMWPNVRKMSTHPSFPSPAFKFQSPGGLENTPVLCYRPEENRPSSLIKQG